MVVLQTKVHVVDSPGLANLSFVFVASAGEVTVIVAPESQVTLAAEPSPAADVGEIAPPESVKVPVVGAKPPRVIRDSKGVVPATT